ncbi:NACHT C-terminal helical domain 2-containing protein [Vasconcelosia minhoensis]|nr:hypothetical protein [Romeria gracilis]
MTSASPNPFGAFEDPVAGGLTRIVLDVARKVGGALFEAVKDKRQAKAALERYEAKYRQRYGSVRILGMRQDYALEQVYTKVKFLDDLSIRRFESLESLEDEYRGRNVRQFNTRERTPQDGTNVVNAHSKLTVLGQPGAGKSTFLRRLGLAAFKDSVEFSLGIDQEFISQARKDWLKSLSLNPEIIEFSKHEIDRLGQYLSVSQLILECKDSALRVSKNTWEVIESRMFTLWEE